MKYKIIYRTAQSSTHHTCISVDFRLSIKPSTKNGREMQTLKIQKDEYDA
jgi:hypothetical protein